MRRIEDFRKSAKRGFRMKPHEITAAGALAAISVSLQVIHLGWLSPWGMWLDLVAIPWIIALFLYGGRTAFAVSLVCAVVITFVDPSTWLGALMKWVATLPMWLLPLIAGRAKGFRLEHFRKLSVFIPIVAASIIIRAAIVIPIDYYFAIPIWTGLSAGEAMNAVPWWAILGMNAIQGAIEMAAAWLLVFRYRLNRFASWQSR